MRFFATIAATAVIGLAVAEQTGETQADNPNSGSVRVLTSDAVTVTVTNADCSGGKCSAAAQTSSPSTARDALTVLSNALNAPTPSNALVILSEAAGSFAIPVVPLTFAPELYSSYGLTGVSPPGEQTSSPEETVAPTEGSAPPATYTTAPGVTSSAVPSAESSVISTTTTPVIVPIPTTTESVPVPVGETTLSTVTSGASTANPVSSPAETGGATTIPIIGSDSSTYGSSVVSPIGEGSSTTIPADTTATGGAGSTTSAGPESTGGNGGSSTSSDVTANPEQTSATETNPVPEATNTNAASNMKPAAFGIVAAVGGLLFI